MTKTIPADLSEQHHVDYDRKPSKKGRDSRNIYVDDVDAQKFYLLTDHDAMCLQPGDLLVYRDRLVQVVDVKKKHTRGGIDWTVILDNGVAFDPQPGFGPPPMKDFIPGVAENGRSMSFYRLRPGF